MSRFLSEDGCWLRLTPLLKTTGPGDDPSGCVRIAVAWISLNVGRDGSRPWLPWPQLGIETRERAGGYQTLTWVTFFGFGLCIQSN